MRKLLVKLLPGLALLFTATLSFAQSEVEMADAMRSNGKIYVIVGIILIVLFGLLAYLFVLDRKVKKLEDLLADKDRKG